MYTPNNTYHSDMINSPVRHIAARVELYEGSTLLHTYNDTDDLISITVERTGENGKFFGFGICQKVNVKLIDKERAKSITTAHSMKIKFGVKAGQGNIYVSTLPTFYITEVHRDENTNALSITAYDALYKAAQTPMIDIAIEAPYRASIYMVSAANAIGLSVSTIGVTSSASYSISYEEGANYSGNESLRDIFNYFAEITQSIYFVNMYNQVEFIRLDMNGDSVLTIDKSKYFTMDSSTNRRLAAICHTTELGDNVSASLEVSGTTQYIRDNPFWNLQADIGTYINDALAAVGGLTINQFECSWRGNYLLEIGDKVSLITKDNETVYAYVLDDVITYDGTYSQKTKWKFTDTATATASNPTTIGEALKQTTARVDKTKQEIELLASKTDANTESISTLLLNTDSINASVQKIQEETDTAFETVNESISTLTNAVEAAISAEDVTIAIKTAMDNGVDRVETSTGFTFNEDGLTVAKTGSEMTTQITENGMQVFKDNTAVLTANNIGVDAVNLHATTYLIIGNNSRFEDFGSDRTGCFWIGQGGNN